MTVVLLYHLVGSSGRMPSNASSLCGCGLHTDAEIRKKMSLGNPIGSSNLQTADAAGFDDLVYCLLQAVLLASLSIWNRI